MSQPPIRIALAVLFGVFLSSCASTIWDQYDPEYQGLLSTAKTNCRGDEVVGVWVTKTVDRFGLAAMRLTMMFKPDGTGKLRRSATEYSDFTWVYSKNGIWTATPNDASFFNDQTTGQYWLPTTIRSSGNVLLADIQFNGGLFAAGSVIKFHQVCVPADDELAVQRTLRKIY